jgi:hypothetical protein
MRLDSRLLTLAKDPDNPGQFQDAFALDAARGIAAIADGVSSALFSGPWATILTQAVVAAAADPRDPATFAAWLAQCRAAWAASIDTSSLAWFQRAKLPTGAFSTLLWIRILEVAEAEAGAFGGFRLVGYAIGDTCLFHIRGGDLVRTFPVQTSAELLADPLALGSVDLNRDQLLQFATLDATCYPDDLLVLCTDAMADWALRCYESGTPPEWDKYWQMPEDAWQAEIISLRHHRCMREDDTTLAMLRVAPQPAAATPEPDAPADAGATEELGWLNSARKEVQSISAKIAEKEDEASGRVLRGIQSLKAMKDKALQKYRDKFGKK